MAHHEKFNISSLEELKTKISELDVDIRLSDDFSVFRRPVKIGKHTAPNALAVLPMEGCDSNRDGSPSELVTRRYHRLAAGGYGLIWWEACAIVEEGRANELQMWLTKDNVGQFASLLADTKKIAMERHGHTTVDILQLTHSGRYSRPIGHKAAPLITQHDPLLDPRVGLKGDEPVVTDEYIDSLVQRYVDSAVLAKEAGFDGVDIKSCHRYFMSELLASHTREGRYGGSFENRTRLLRDTIKAVRKAVGDDFIIACRFNVFDAHPYPYGFGVDKEDYMKFDPAEPMALVRMLCDLGVNLLSNSGGNPYYLNPQVTRPFDTSSLGIPTPDEHPLESIARLFYFTRLIQKEAGDIPVVGNGYTWLRQFISYAGAANLSDHSCSFIGLGRSSFAYPDAPSDIMNKGMLDPNKCCITCSKCTQMMRDHSRTGCPIRDSKVYMPIYKQARDEAEERENAAKK
jgi:2,4-dienoyl-CoA reductase (NADPH2)